MKTELSRRAVVAIGALAIPVLSATAFAGTSKPSGEGLLKVPDPIFAAIARHRAAQHELTAADECESAAYDRMADGLGTGMRVPSVEILRPARVATLERHEACEMVALCREAIDTAFPMPLYKREREAAHKEFSRQERFLTRTMRPSRQRRAAAGRSEQGARAAIRSTAPTTILGLAALFGYVADWQDGEAGLFESDELEAFFNSVAKSTRALAGVTS